jgi:hypothetical protein
VPEVAERPRTQKPRGSAVQIGDWVYFWAGINKDHLHPVPAQVIHHAPPGGLEGVHLNIHELGTVSSAMNISYSGKPQLGCWSHIPKK